MADLILEFGCSSCYLQDINCGADCVFELRIDLSQLFPSAPPSNYFHQDINGTFNVKKDFFYGKRIPDVYRYDLRYCKNKNKWALCEPNSTNAQQVVGNWVKKTIADYKRYEKPIENDEAAKNILIILESPHDDEYHYPNNQNPHFTALQPANGTTGINFSKYFTDGTNASGKNTNGGILAYTTTLEPLQNLLNQDDVYRICFVNPVPFQTSLHFIHGYALKIFAKDLRDIVWKKLFIHCKSDFVRRINLYKPFAILNACTGDSTRPNDLKGQVKATVGNIANHQFNTPHPSSWWSRKNRRCTKW